MTSLKVRDVMKRGTLTFRSSTTVRDAASRMFEEGEDNAPVLDNEGKIIGILEKKDILSYISDFDGTDGQPSSLDVFDRCYSSQIRTRAVCLAYEKAGSSKISSIMNEEFLSLSPEDDISDAIETMIRFDVERLPVAQNERFIGVAEKEDLLWTYHQWLRHTIESRHG